MAGTGRDAVFAAGGFMAVRRDRPVHGDAIESTRIRPRLISDLHVADGSAALQSFTIHK